MPKVVAQQCPTRTGTWDQLITNLIPYSLHHRTMKLWKEPIKYWELSDLRFLLEDTAWALYAILGKQHTVTSLRKQEALLLQRNRATRYVS